MSEKTRKFFDIALFSVLTVILLWVSYSVFSGQLIFDLLNSNADNFQRYLLNLGIWSRLAYVASVITEVLIAFIPGWIIYPAGAAVFGFEQTVYLVLIGNFVGASISFWIGQKWGQPLLRKFIAGKYIQQFDEYMEKRGTWSIFLLKLNPLTSLDIWNYLAGSSPMPFWKFTAANMLGITPLVLISTFFGEEAFELTPQILGVLVLLTLVYVMWFIISLPRKLARSRKQ